jgi:hypothetical protein
MELMYVSKSLINIANSERDVGDIVESECLVRLSEMP